MTIDKEAAIKEISALSQNARRHLVDRIANNYQVIRSCNYLRRRTEMIDQAIDKLVEDMEEMGLFK